MASPNMKNEGGSSEGDFDPSDLDSEISDAEIDDLSDLCDDDLSTGLFDHDVVNAGGKSDGDLKNEYSQSKKKGTGTQPLGAGISSATSNTDYRGGLSRSLFENLRNSNLVAAQSGKKDTDETGSVSSKKRQFEETFNRLQRGANSKRSSIRRHSIHNTDIGSHRTFSQSLMGPHPFGHDGDEDPSEFGERRRVKSDMPMRSNSVGALDQSILAGIDFGNLNDGEYSSDSEEDSSDDDSDDNNFFLSGGVLRYQKSTSMPLAQDFAGSSFPTTGHNMSNMVFQQRQDPQRQQIPPAQFLLQSQATPNQQPPNPVLQMINSSNATAKSGFYDSANSFASNQMSAQFNSTFGAHPGEAPASNIAARFDMSSSGMSLQSQMAPTLNNGYQSSKFATAPSSQSPQQQPQQPPCFDTQLQSMPVAATPFSQCGPDTNPTNTKQQKDQPEVLPPCAEPVPIQEQPSAEIDQNAMMAKLSALMTRSMETQKSLQEFDKRNGLPRSHSQTMVKSNRSRRQLQEGVILKKWDGSPLLSFDKDGKVKDGGTAKKRQTKKATKKTSTPSGDKTSAKRDSSPFSSKGSATDIQDESLEPLAL